MQIVAKAKKLPGMTGEKKDKKEKEQAGDGPPGSGLRFFFLWSCFALFFSLSLALASFPSSSLSGSCVASMCDRDFGGTWLLTFAYTCCLHQRVCVNICTCIYIIFDTCCTRASHVHMHALFY